MVVVFFIILLMIMFGVVWYLEHEHPVHTLIGTTPIPPEQFFSTLAQHKERHRQGYIDNAFVQMLHQVHHTTNTTNCWVCGLLPSVGHKNNLLVSLPLSYLSSCEAWFQLLSMIYIYYHADAMNMTQADYEAVLEYIVVHQGYTPGEGEKEGTLHPDACMNLYENNKNATWLQDEMLDFQGFNVTAYFNSFHIRNIIDKDVMPVPVVHTAASFCQENERSSACHIDPRTTTPMMPAY